MTQVKKPPKSSILDSLDYSRVEAGRKVYCNKKRDRQYTWDSQHGEVEVFNKAGAHLGVADPVTGR